MDDSEDHDGLDHIVEDLWPLAVDINTVKPMKGNARKGDVESVKRSLSAFGQRKPIVAMADGTMTAGHHMHAAAVALGWQKVAVVFVDDDPITAKAFSLADNRTGDLGRYDNELLVESLVEVRDADAALLEATSYSQEDVSDLLAYLEGPPPSSDSDGGGDDSGGGGAPSLDSCPNCGFDLT